jgi:hypothetical protein
MSLIQDLLEKSPNLSTASKNTVVNGIFYLGGGALLIAWPTAVQTLFREAAFVGHEEGLIRMVGLMLAVIGWLYLFGGRSTNRRRFRGRPIGFRSCGVGAPGDSRRVSSFSRNVRDPRPDAGHRCLGASRSKDVIAANRFEWQVQDMADQ